MANVNCAHLGMITTVKHAKHRECDECVKIGARWVHLRACQECGATLCCDSSPNRHATKHARSSGHPVIASAEPASAGCTATLTTPSRNTDRQTVIKVTLDGGSRRRTSWPACWGGHASSGCRSNTACSIAPSSEN